MPLMIVPVRRMGAGTVGLVRMQRKWRVRLVLDEEVVNT